MELRKRIIYCTLFLIIVILISITLSSIAYIFRVDVLHPKNYISNLDYNFVSESNKQYQRDGNGNKWNFKNVIAWIPAFDYQRGKDDFYANSSYFTEVSPGFYETKPDGTISPNSYVGDTNLITLSHRVGVKVTPTITSFNEGDLQVMLNDPIKLLSHNDYILAEIKKYNYDGIDLDYESINLADKDVFFKMLSDLSTKLHNNGKILSLSVISKDKDNGFNSFLETRDVQDWTKIGQLADEIRIMAYDYSDSNNKGPVSPINWVENILQYAVNKTDKYKIILGQPLYAYAYGQKRYAYTYNEIDEIIKAQNINPTFNIDTNEMTLDCKKGDETRTLYFQNYETMLRRFSDIHVSGIGGISYWRLGGEDQRIYKALKELR